MKSVESCKDPKETTPVPVYLYIIPALIFYNHFGLRAECFNDVKNFERPISQRDGLRVNIYETSDSSYSIEDYLGPIKFRRVRDGRIQYLYNYAPKDGLGLSVTFQNDTLIKLPLVNGPEWILIEPLMKVEGGKFKVYEVKHIEIVKMSKTSKNQVTSIK